MLRPKKSLGQNFLKDKNIARKIVSAAAPVVGEHFVEIGAGTGFLTEELLKENINLSAFEIDSRAIDILKDKFEGCKNLEIVHEDFLKADLAILSEKKKAERFKAAGNLPYYISGRILFKLFYNRHFISQAVIMLQKEVARRLTAKTSTKDYGILSAAAQLAGKPEILFDVSPKCFFPVPEVTSSVVSISFFKETGWDDDYEEIIRLVKSAFNMRRKKLRNALSAYISEKTSYKVNDIEEFAFENGNDWFTRRAEELTPENFVELYRFLENLKKSSDNNI